MENKQTAVDWLVEQYANENYGIEVYEQAKAMEKEQIMKAYKDNNYARYVHDLEIEQYYNETYGK